MKGLLGSTGRIVQTDLSYVLRAGSWVHASSLLVSLFSFVAYVVFAHTLPKEVYGTYQYLLSIGALIGALSLTGMASAVSTAVARGEDGVLYHVVRTQLTWSVLPVLASLGLSLYYLVSGDTLLSIGLVVIAVCVPFINTYNVYNAFLVGKKDFKRSFFLGLLLNGIYYGSLIAAALWSPTVIALIGASLVSQAVGYYLCYRMTLRAYAPQNTPHQGTIRYGKHLSALNAVGTIATYADAFLIFHLLGAELLAIYSFATAIPDRLGVAKTLSFIALPKLANRTHVEIRATLMPRLLAACGVLAALAGAYALFAHYIFALFFPAYLNSVPYSQLYALTLITSLSGFLVTALISQQLVKRLYVYNVVAPILQLGALVAGVLVAGLWGLIIAKVAATALSTLLALGLVLYTPRARAVS